MASGDFLDLSERAMRAAQMADSSGTAYSAGDLAQAKALVNEAYLSCLDDGSPWDFLELEGQWDAVAGSDKYSSASISTAMSVTGATIREIYAMTIDTDGVGRLLTSTSWEHLESLAYSTKESSESTGVPAYWAKWGNQNAPAIRLYPNPDDAYRLGAFCYLSPTALSADADLPILPAPWRHRIIVPYAAALLLEQEGGGDAGAAYERLMRRYEASMLAMRTAYATFKRPTGNAVQPGFFERRDESGWATGWGGW